MYILLDKSRVLNVVDPLAREAYISLGALIKTLQSSLDAFGYKTQISYNNELNNPLAAEISYILNVKP